MQFYFYQCFLLFIFLLYFKQMRNLNIGQSTEIQQITHNPPEFVKGMKLDQYVALLNSTQSGSDQEYQELLVTQLQNEPCQQNLQKNKSNFDIPEIDQENYSQSKEQNRMKKKITDTQRSEMTVPKKEKQIFLRRSIHMDENSKQIGSISNCIQKKSNSKLKKQDNRESPILNSKDKKQEQLLKSLYGTKYIQKFKQTHQNQKIQSNIFNNTLHLQGFYLNQNKKDETYFKNLNKKQFLELQKYEKVIASKYLSKQGHQSNPFSAKGQRLKQKFDTKKDNLIFVKS